ncbi:hypothetical protein MRX96_038649 [Rhipicephalus microplus]
MNATPQLGQGGRRRGGCLANRRRRLRMPLPAFFLSTRAALERTQPSGLKFSRAAASRWLPNVGSAAGSGNNKD